MGGIYNDIPLAVHVKSRAQEECKHEWVYKSKPVFTYRNKDHYFLGIFYAGTTSYKELSRIVNYKFCERCHLTEEDYGKAKRKYIYA